MESNFISYVEDDNGEGIIFHKPLSWTHQMYEDWCVAKKISSDGSSRIERGSRIGKNVDIQPDTALSSVSIPLGLSDGAPPDKEHGAPPDKEHENLKPRFQEESTEMDS